MAEAQMRNALSIGEGKWTVFLERPASAVLLAIVVAILVLPRVLKRRVKDVEETLVQPVAPGDT